MLLNLTSDYRLYVVMWLFIISSSQMLTNSSQESDLSNKKNFVESRRLFDSQGTQSYQKPNDNYLQLPSNKDKYNDISSRKTEAMRFLNSVNRNSRASAEIEFNGNKALMWFTTDNAQNTKQKEKNSPWQGSGIPVHDRKNSSDVILPTTTTNGKISKLDKREAKIKDTSWWKSKDVLKKIKPQRRQKPYKDLVRSESVRLSKDDSSTTTSQDSIIGRLRRTLVSLFGGSKHSSSMEDVMKVDDAVALSFPQSTLSTFFSSSKNEQETRPFSPIQALNNSHSLTKGIHQEYPRTPPFVQDEPSYGNLMAFRTNPHTNLRNIHSVTRRSRNSKSDESYEGFQFSSNEQTEDYNYDSLKYSDDNIKPKFPVWYDKEYDNEKFTDNKEESQSNPHSFKAASQNTPVLLKITRDSENKIYDLFNGSNVNLSTNIHADSMENRSPRFVTNLNDDSRKFPSNKLSKTGSTRNYKSPKVLLYIRNDKPGTISHGSDISSSTEEVVQTLYKHLLKLHESTSLNKDITSQSSSYNPQYASPQKSATVSYKDLPSSGSYRTASENGNTYSGPLTHNTQSNIDRSKKILHLSSQLSLIIEDEATSLKNIPTGTDSRNNLQYYKSQTSPRVPMHNQDRAHLDNSLMRKLDIRNANIKPQEKDRSSSFALPIPVEYPQQREKFSDTSANLWRTPQEHKSSYSHSQRSGYKPKIDEKPFQTNHRDSIKTAGIYNRRRALSPYNKPKPDTIISKSSGDVSIKVRLPSELYRNPYDDDDDVQPSLRSNTESKYKHYSSPSLKKQSNPFDNQYSYSTKHYERSSEENDDEKITANDLNFSDIIDVVKHGFRTAKFYWDMIKNGWPILLDDS